MKIQSKNIKQVHEALVRQLIADTQPVRAMASPLTQWSLWLFVVVVLFAVMNSMMKPVQLEHPLGLPALVYMAALFFGAALAAWKAVTSSVPGRNITRLQLILLAVFLAAVVILPFVFFVPQGEELFEMDDIVKCGPECFKTIVLIGILPWLFLGWSLSRNASFNAKATGAWSGLSAFLLGSLVCLMHCGYWEAGHMVAVHLATVAFFTFLTTWAGTYWFSKWRKYLFKIS